MKTKLELLFLLGGLVEPWSVLGWLPEPKGTEQYAMHIHSYACMGNEGGFRRKGNGTKFSNMLTLLLF
jgi:hypothetical protein